MNRKHVVFICDNNYVLPTVVAMRSLIDSVKNPEDYVIHICTIGLSNENLKKITSVSDGKCSVEINTVDLSVYEGRVSKINQKTHVSSSALIKFELPNIFNDLDYILYLDGDIIIKKDIGDLFNLDMSGNYVAAVQEFWKVQQQYYEYSNVKIKLPFYFNSGLMFMNLKLMREDRVSSLLWKAKLAYFNDAKDDKHVLMDQDTFNKVCFNRCVKLPIKYNCDSKFTNEANLELMNDTYGTNYYNYRELYDDVSVIHYIGKEEKPWKFEGVCCQQEWDSVYKKTVYENDNLLRKRIQHNVAYFIPKIVRSIHDRGLLRTIRYIYDKRNIIKR